METGFEKVGTNNLPKIDFEMINNFFIKSVQFQNAEVQNIKMIMATRENYGDNAVGYVQLRREKNSSVCIIKAKITPEHRVTAKSYAVSIVVNEKDEEVVSCECQDCTASTGGCKHAVAFLMWLHRRSEEPAVTSVSCYWRTSKLSKVGKTLKGCTISELYSKDSPAVQTADSRFMNKFIETGKQCGSHSMLATLYNEDAVEKTSLPCLSIKYVKLIQETKSCASADSFVRFCNDKITEEICLFVQALTVKQSKTAQWYTARFGRITASKLFEMSRSQTYDGSLVESIFGSTKISTEHMKLD